MSDTTNDDSSHAGLRFPPPSEGAADAIASEEDYLARHRRSVEDPESFFLDEARSLRWFRTPERALSWNAPHARWFDDGTLNASVNCLDRHVEDGRGDKTALIWEGEPGEVRRFDYQELQDAVSRAANAMRSLGVARGDRVGIYLGMVPEAVIAMLACARLGAVHTVVFGGFASDALADRLNDAGAKLLVTQDGGYRRAAIVPLKQNADRALVRCPSVTAVLVVNRLGGEVAMTEGRDHDWAAALADASPDCPPEVVDAEHPLFILYTSGTTGKPKGVLHTTGGYLLGAAMTTKHVFSLRDEDTYFCTADVGWITGHSYVVYGPLANGGTVLLYEGAPNTPNESRIWSMIERHRVTILYTAPTAIRAFIRWGDHHPASHDLSSLRVLGSVGEPINPEAWLWYHRVIGKGRCPIVDTWWQTETGAIMVAPLPYAIPTKPGSCTKPFFGVLPKVVREDGSDAPPGEAGLLVIDKPWPWMLRTVWGDDARFRETYFSRFPGRYFTGDGAKIDEDGYLWVIGRVDDVLNVSGHRLGTAEVESALVSHAAVAEAAAVARPDELKGEALVVFVTLKLGVEPTEPLRNALADHVAAEIGKFAKPDAVRFANALPKTRSGKIVRRLLKELAAGKVASGDTTTLEDVSVLASLAADEA